MLHASQIFCSNPGRLLGKTTHRIFFTMRESFLLYLAQEATVKKIVKIVREQFAEEIQYKESEIALIDQVILDKLHAFVCAVSFVQ